MNPQNYNMSKPVDMELKKAFADLQTKMIESKKKISTIDSQLVTLESAQRIVEATQRQVGALPADTKTYETLGRMFVLTDVGEVNKNLAEKRETLKTKQSELEKTKKYLAKSVRDSEDNIREMLQQRKESDAKS